MAKPSKTSAPHNYNEACLLVGQFMFGWALLESALNDAVEEVIGVSGLGALILTANLQLRSKLHVLKTVIHLCASESAWGKEALKDVESIGNLADKWRNVVAHVPFGPARDGSGVKFLAIRAKGKLVFPGTVWTREDFAGVAAQMETLKNKLTAIVRKLSDDEMLALMNSPTGAARSKELPDRLVRLAQELPSLGTPTSEQSPQADPE